MKNKKEVFCMLKTVFRKFKMLVLALFLAALPNLSFGQSARLWVANGLAETASRIILDSGQVANHVLTLGIIPNQIVVSDNYLLAVNSGESNIQVFNRNTLAEIGTIELGPNKNPWNLVMVDSAVGYVTNFNTNTVSKFNAISRTVLDEFPVGQSPEGLTFARGKIWVCNTGFNPNDFSYGQGELAVIDPAADSVVARINVGTNPQAVKHTPDGKLLVVCTGNFGSIAGSLYIIDPASQTVTDSILTGGQPSTAAVTFGNIAYLPAGGFVGNGSLFKVNLNTRSVERGTGNPIPVGLGATDAVFDVDSGWVYVACFSDGTVKKIGSSDAVLTSYQMGDGPVSLDIAYPYKAGDLNGDHQATPADVAQMLLCVFAGCTPVPRNSQLDLNWDGQKTPGDVVCELNHVFLGVPLPCR
jgi:DNA-binding beta-propeller fold protein YncE